MSAHQPSWSEADFARYRATARARQAAERAQVATRHQRAWEIARLAADILKRDFGVQRVVVFGSLLHAERFHLRSDVDLAVWGMPERSYLRAVGQLLRLDPHITVDVIEVEYAKPLLREAIEREGQEL